MAIIYFLVVILCLFGSSRAYNIYHTPVYNEPEQNIDSLTQDYLAAEENLWHLIRSTTDINLYTTLGQIYDTHQGYFSKRFGETGVFDRLFKQLQNPHRELPFFTRLYGEIINDIRNLNFTTNNVYQILFHNSHDRLPSLVEDIRTRFPAIMHKISRNMDEPFWLFIKNNSQTCDKYTKIVYAENHLLMQYYREIVAALLRGYMSLQMSFMVLTTNGIGNYRYEGEQLRRSFRYNVSVIQDEVRIQMRNSSREMWACDPDNYENTDSYIEITRFFQGYLDNELNLNNEDNCRHSCSHYIYTHHFNCEKNSFCDAPENQWINAKGVCRGVVYNCGFVESDLTICPADFNSQRRYEFLKYDSGRVLGRERTCQNEIKANSWSRWFVECSNCFCYCDEPGPLSDRYFSLAEVVSNVYENKIVTGIAITKINRVIQLKISERELLPNGQVGSKVSTVFDNGKTAYFSDYWKTGELFSVEDFGIHDGVHYHTLTWSKRAVDLDTVVVSPDHVVTGVRFQIVDGHLRLEARATRFDHETGFLKFVNNSMWVGNDSKQKYKLPLQNADISTRSYEKSIPIRGSQDYYVEFGPSDVNRDAAQSTVPFIDATPLDAMTPLSGVGLHYKTQYGYGGFIAPKVIIYDLDTHITPPKTPYRGFQ